MLRYHQDKEEHTIMATTQRLKGFNLPQPMFLNWLGTFLVAMLLMALAPAQALAAPLAGTSIGNQAAASYTDASAVSRNVTSNTVSTIVQQVASFALTASQTKTVSPGGTVYYPHTLTNTGNGTDTFNLSTTNLSTNGITPSTFDFSSITLYADANGDGIPDNAIAITSTNALIAGGVFRFVAAAIVPGTATNGNVDYLNVTAIGTALAPGANAPAQSNLDTATVSGNAVINVTKSISASSGASPSGPYTYTLTYTNTGNSTASALTLLDVIPTGMTYVGASGRWSTTGGTILTDLDTVAQGSAPNTIVYDFGVTVGNRVTAVINQIPAGSSGTLTFQVNVNTGVVPGAINNTASYTYNDSVTTVASQNTNTAAFTVNQTAALTLTGATVASAAQGSTVPFTNVLTNTGNGIDSFDITVGTSTFPVGTTFQLFKSDGVTPLVDTNGNSTPDTGPLAAGATYNVILKATLPAGATGGPYTVQKTATSKFNPAVAITTTDTLTAISASTVDLTNNTARSDSLPAGTAAAGNAATTGFGSTATAVITTNTTNPGTTTRFTLFVNNTAGPADSYNLAASAVPVGWSVVFRNVANAIITNTGVVNGGANVQVFADVTVPSNASPGATNIDFTSTSPTTGASDVKRDAVTVNAINAVTLTPNNSGQVFPGGSVVYSHTLTNNGNVAQTITFPTAAFLTDSQVAAGWTSILYRDNGTTPGSLDAGDTAVTTATTFSLPAGASQILFVKVTAPLGAAIGVINSTTATVTFPTGTAVATDTTTVIGGQVTLTKLQALDANCDGVADSAFSTTSITTGAVPGACVRYQITATNVGTSNATVLVVSDATPSNTTYHATVPAATTIGTVTAPAGGSVGTISATVGTLTPGQSAVVTFGVRIDP